MDILKSSTLRWAALTLVLAYTAAVPLSLSPSPMSPEKAARVRIDLDQDSHDGHWGEALFSAQRMLKAFPQDPAYLSWEAEIYDHLGDSKSASAAYELSMSLAPDPTDNCPGLGRAYVKQGLMEKALDADRRCLAVKPTNSDLRLYYALALERTGRYEEARKAFESVLAVAPRYTDATEGLARLDQRRKEARR